LSSRSFPETYSSTDRLYFKLISVSIVQESAQPGCHEGAYPPFILYKRRLTCKSALSPSKDYNLLKSCPLTYKYERRRLSFSSPVMSSSEARFRSGVDDVGFHVALHFLFYPSLTAQNRISSPPSLSVLGGKPGSHCYSEIFFQANKPPSARPLVRF